MQMNLPDSARAIFQTALDAANPRQAIQRVMRRDGQWLLVQNRAYDLSQSERVFVIGFGKAGAPMAQAVEEILGDRLTSGWVTVKYEHKAPLATERIHLHEAGHPLLDENSLLGTQKIFEILDAATERDLIICLISGGGSALLELPVETVTLADLRSMTDVLLRSGATINELNTVRKHISQVKGGQLLRRAARSQMVALILSDVIGSLLDTIASGPTAPDATTFADALAVIEQRGLRDLMPSSIMRYLDRGGSLNSELETPKTGDPIFSHVQNVIVADNTSACAAAFQAARQLGFNALLLSTFVQGEAQEIARMLAAIAKEIDASGQPTIKPACVVCGGETTVTVRGRGKGGRNQEIALAAAIEISGISTSHVVVLSGGTDGTDGPTDAAGAIADETTVARATLKGLDARSFLAANDAYNFFLPLNDLLITGPTGTNVNDVMLVMLE
jgi:glycerate 2-kinase